MGGNCRMLLKTFFVFLKICKQHKEECQRNKEKIEVLYILIKKQHETFYAKPA